MYYLPNTHIHCYRTLNTVYLDPRFKGSTLEIDILSTPPTPPHKSTRKTLPQNWSLAGFM